MIPNISTDCCLVHSRSVTQQRQHPASVQLVKAHRHLQAVHGRYQESRISQILVHRRHLTFAIDNDALIATFSEGRDPWRD
jgi:hypothetical protein